MANFACSWSGPASVTWPASVQGNCTSGLNPPWSVQPHADHGPGGRTPEGIVRIRRCAQCRDDLPGPNVAHGKPQQRLCVVRVQYATPVVGLVVRAAEGLPILGNASQRSGVFGIAIVQDVG